jgi:hypothetical protein
MTALASLSHLAADTPAGTDAWTEYRGIIEDGINGQPRSQ